MCFEEYLFIRALGQMRTESYVHNKYEIESFFSDVNTAPTIQNIGENQLVHVYFDETTPTDTLLFTPNVYDPDAGQTQTISYSVFPAAEVGMFDVSTSKFLCREI